MALDSVFNQIKIPFTLLDSMKMVGGLTTPISMLVIGSLLSRADLKGLVKDLRLYYASCIKLILIPITLYLVSSLFIENRGIVKDISFFNKGGNSTNIVCIKICMPLSRTVIKC